MSTSSLQLRPVVLIDDSPDDLVFARRRLDRGGVRNPVLTFLSSEDAVAHLGQLGRAPRTAGEMFPSVVFLDIRMPKLGGFDVLRWIRRQDALAGVTVAMLSGSDEPRDQRQARALLADHYLVKFPAPEVFAQIVAAAGSRGAS